MTADLSSSASSDPDRPGTAPDTAVAGRRATAGRGRATGTAACLAITDLWILVLTGGLAWMIPAAAPDAGPVLHLFAIAAVAQLALKALLGLYPGFGLHPEARLRKGVTAWGVAALLAGLSGALLLAPQTGSLAGAIAGPVALALLFFAVAGLAQGIGRRLVLRTLRRRGLWGLPVQVLGDPEQVQGAIDFLLRHPDYGLVPVQDVTGRPVIAATTALWAGETVPDAATLQWLRNSYAEIVLLSDLPGLALSGIRPSDHDGTIGLRLSGAGRRGAMPAGKRLFDLALAGPCALIAAPVIAVAALMIRAADSGAVFFTQQRDGLLGRQIGVLKLRTMYRDADRMLEALLARDPEARAEWETHFKLRRDPRILPVVGRLLRATSLDELPQLWNILRGDMSLVGPRPFPGYHLEAMPSEFRRRRASVVPGLTGLWQISDRSDGDLDRQQALDGYYIDNRSFWLDLSILLRTFGAVLSGRGAY